MPGLWICLTILHGRQAFEDASGSEYGMVVYARVTQSLNMSEYGLICPINA